MFSAAVFPTLQLFLSTVPGLIVQSTTFCLSSFLLLVFPPTMKCFPSNLHRVMKPTSLSAPRAYMCVLLCVFINARLYLRAWSGAMMEVQREKNGNKNFNLTSEMQPWTSNMAASGCVTWCVHVCICVGGCSCVPIGAPSSCLSGSERPGSPGGRGRWIRHRG